VGDAATGRTERREEVRSLAISASIGILVGFLLGRFVLLLPPAWAIVVAFVASLSVFIWAFRSLREVSGRPI
jgi:CBS-domain-containing membrane protein